MIGRRSYLQKEAEGETRLEGAVAQKGLEERRATGIGEIVPEAGVERTRQWGVRRGGGDTHGRFGRGRRRCRATRWGTGG